MYRLPEHVEAELTSIDQEVEESARIFWARVERISDGL